MLGVSVHGTTPSKRYRARTSTGTGGPPFRVHVSPYSFSRPKMRRLIALCISKARALFCRTPCRRGDTESPDRPVVAIALHLASTQVVPRGVRRSSRTPTGDRLDRTVGFGP